MQKQPPQQEPEPIPRLLFLYLNEYEQLQAKTRLVLTTAEAAEILTLSGQKVRWMMLRGELPSFHIGSRRLVSLDSLEHYLREREIEEQQDRLFILERYYGSFRFGDPHPEIQRTQKRLNAMQQLQGQTPSQERGKKPVAIEAALYRIDITEAGRLECTPRWLLSMQEAAQLLGISRATLWKLSKEGDFPTFHINDRVFVRVESLLNWIREKEHPEPEQPKMPSASSKNKKPSKTRTKRRNEL